VILYQPKFRTQQATQHAYRVPDGLQSRRFDFYEIREGQGLIDAPRPVLEGTRHDLFWIDPEGKILRQEEVLLPHRSPTDDPRTGAWEMAFAMPSPLAAAIAVPATWISSKVESDTAAAIRAAFAQSWAPMLVVLLIGVAAAWLCYRQQKRYDQPWTGLWVVFVLLAGIPGLLGYLWHRRWPTVMPCPSCGASAPRDRNRCIRCGSEFPAPAPQGIEVFAA